VTAWLRQRLKEDFMRLLMVAKNTSRNGPQLSDGRTFVVRANNVDDGLSMLRHETFGLVVVDITSLSEEGFAFIRRLRLAKNDTPLIALTGSHSAERVRALGLGADDAVAQPIDPDELRARISAVIRRYKGYSRPLLQCGGLSLSTDTREVHFGDKPLKVTGKEYSMLELLILRKGQFVTKEMFLNHLYGGMDEPEKKIIDVFICKLRRKLIAVGASRLITTVWGRGYALRDPDERQLQASVADSRIDPISVPRPPVSIAPPNTRLSADWSAAAATPSRWAELPQQRMVRQ
jgi:two-component system cell cycle response regulator CtrA